jgi:multicomponent Na+:H+ antiporter subunit E
MLLGNIMLAVAWAALQGEFSVSQLGMGYLLGYVILAALARGGVLPSTYPRRVRAVLALAAFLGKELVLANIKMAFDVMGPTRRIQPGIVRVPLDATGQYEVLLLSTLINLTPGSIVLDIANDRSALYLHVVHVSTAEAVRAEIKAGFERRVLAVLR